MTAVVVTVKLAEVLPAAIVTDGGTDAKELPLEIATVVPPLTAGRVRVTVPVEGFPPMTAVGLSVSEANVAGFTVSVAV